MAFKFRFKPLLQRRKYVFETAQLDLVAARNHHEHVRAARDRARNKIEELQKLIDEQQNQERGGINIAYYISMKEYLQTLEQQLLKKEEELRQAAHQVEEKKKILLEKEKEVRMLENLEDKDRQLYRFAQLQSEQKQSDEVAVLRDFANRRETRED